MMIIMSCQKYFSPRIVWNQTVFSQGSDYVSRKDIVCFIANKDGGAHVDKEKWPIDKYKESQLLGFYNQNGDSPDGNPLYAAMRQIAEEYWYHLKYLNSKF